MQYTTLGNTGLLVSRIGFGALTFTEGNRALPSVYKVGAKLATEMVGKALDAGVNLFDSADVYADGESERLLGAALEPYRDKVILATKVGNRGSKDRTLVHAGLSRRHILWSVDQSLERLGSDWIDLYIAHKEDPYTPLEETLEAFDAVVRSGKVRYIGFSNWTAWAAEAALEIQKANGLAPFTHGQMYYSLLGRDIERDFVPMTRRYGLGLTVWSPLAFGFLSGTYSREDLSKPENRFSNFDMLGFDREKAFGVVDVLRRIAERHSVSPARAAIAWVLARERVDSVLIGATRLHQLEDNLGAVDLVLAEEDMAELDEATAITTIYGTSQWVTSDRVVRRALES